jgi:hypothetical protein
MGEGHENGDVRFNSRNKNRFYAIYMKETQV